MSRDNRRRINPEMVRQKRRRWLTRLLKAGLLGSAAVATGAGLWWLNDAMRIESWSVEGPAELQTAVELQLTRDKEQLDLIHAWPSRLHDSLLAAVPDLDDVLITRQLPDHLQLVAIPRKPVALWQNEDKVWLVDAKANAYRPLQAGESPDLPLLRVAGNELADSIGLLAALQAANADRLAKLSELRADANDWRLYFARGERWLLPRQQTARQLARLNHILNSPHWKSGVWRVDARTATRWYLRPASQGGVI